MEGYCSTGQSRQWAVVPMEEEEVLEWCVWFDNMTCETYCIDLTFIGPCIIVIVEE